MTEQKKVKINSPDREINPNARPWALPKINWTIRLNPETEHIINLMTLHFGISKNNVVVHAIHKLWSEVAPTIERKRLADYEQKVKAARLWRITKNELAAQKARAERLEIIKQKAQRDAQIKRTMDARKARAEKAAQAEQLARQLLKSEEQENSQSNDVDEEREENNDVLNGSEFEETNGEAQED